MAVMFSGAKAGGGALSVANKNYGRWSPRAQRDYGRYIGAYNRANTQGERTALSKLYNNTHTKKGERRAKGYKPLVRRARG